MSNIEYEINGEYTQQSQGGFFCEIFFENEKGVYQPVLCDEIILSFSRRNSPSSLEFTCIRDENLLITEGDAVSFKFNGNNMFYGYVFQRSESSPYKLSVLCYDQLRYLKNKTTISYGNKKYSEVLAMVASANKLKIGDIEDTGHIIAQRIDEGTLFDILANAQDETTAKTGEEFVLYDDFGKLCLKEIGSLFVPVMFDEEAIGEYKYVTGIDKDVYTKITISKDNDYTGQRELCVEENKEMQAKWGILEYWEPKNNLEKGEIQEIARELLSKYSQKKKSLSLTSCLGDYRIRGGSSFFVAVNLNDRKINEIMIVESVRHSFKSGVHTMNLDLSSLR